MFFYICYGNEAIPYANSLNCFESLFLVLCWIVIELIYWHDAILELFFHPEDNILFLSPVNCLQHREDHPFISHPLVQATLHGHLGSTSCWTAGLWPQPGSFFSSQMNMYSFELLDNSQAIWVLKSQCTLASTVAVNDCQQERALTGFVQHLWGASCDMLDWILTLPRNQYFSCYPQGL